MKSFRSLLTQIAPSFSKRSTTTVRFAFPVMLLSSVFLATAITGLDSSHIRVETSESAVRANERFSVNVYAYANVPVNAVDVKIQFPKDQIEVLGIDTGQSVITIWTEDPHVEGNRVLLSGGTYNKGFKGEHLIATVNMRAKQTGEARLSTADVRLLAGDGTGTSVPTAVQNTGSTNLIILNENANDSEIRAAASLKIVTDINGDGKVTLADISAFMGAWFDRSRVYDFNGDGRMTFRDFSIILADSFTK